VHTESQLLLASSAALAKIQPPKTTKHMTFKIPLDQQAGERQTYHTELGSPTATTNQTDSRQTYFSRQIALA